MHARCGASGRRARSHTGQSAASETDDTLSNAATYTRRCRQSVHTARMSDVRSYYQEVEVHATVPRRRRRWPPELLRAHYASSSRGIPVKQQS